MCGVDSSQKKIIGYTNKASPDKGNYHTPYFPNGSHFLENTSIQRHVKFVKKNLKNRPALDPQASLSLLVKL